MSSVVPAFTHLPQLESFAFIVWRDRHFTADLFRHVSASMPDLKELTVVLENQGLNWWPGSMVSRDVATLWRLGVLTADVLSQTDYGLALATLTKLETLIWNFTPVSVPA